MKKYFLLIIILTLIFNNIYSQDKIMKEKGIKISITVGGKKLTATLIDNATSRALIKKLPLKILMKDLYNREMCHHFSEELPTDAIKYTGYEVGEIIYWPPKHSFVIMYDQNGEQFSMQKIGIIDSGVEIFKNTGDIVVSLELIK